MGLMSSTYLMVPEDLAVPWRNAFEVLLANQQELSQPILPSFVEKRNNKDRLYNSILCLLESKELKRRPGTASTHGIHFVRTLTNMLWCIDGHHDLLEKQSLAIPKVFQNLIYSVQYARTIQAQEMEGTKPWATQTSKFFLWVVWDQKGWNVFKPEVELIANSLRSYSNLLRKQQLRMKAVHASPAPVRTLSDRLSVKFLRKRSTSDPLYGELNSDVLKVSPCQCLSLCKYLPEDKYRRYTYISNLSENILQECLLITDSPDNNVGNAYFDTCSRCWFRGCQTGEESKCTGGDQGGIARISHSGNASYSF